MQGCSHILMEEDCQKIKYGRPGMCVDLLLEAPSGLAREWQGAVLQYPTINYMVGHVRLEDINSKVLFQIHKNSSPYGLSYEYDSTISQIAAYIEDYRSEVFSGNRKPSAILRIMAQAVLEKAETSSAAIKWILLDEPPVGCRSLSQFLLDILESQYRAAAEQQEGASHA